jgi:superfamily II DNA or RNA helicase
LNKFLKFNSNSEKPSIRIINSKNNEYSGTVDICTIQLLNSNVELRNKLKNRYGILICDEAHHVSSFTYQTVLREFNAKYIYGQTATIERFDKLEKIIELIIGPVLYEQQAINEDKFKKILIPRFTRFTSNFINDTTAMTNELIVDTERNNMIIDDIKREYDSKRHILVLTDRLNHIQKL